MGWSNRFLISFFFLPSTLTMSLVSLKKELQQCQAKIQGESYAEAKAICEKILHNRDISKLSNEELPLIFTVYCFQGLTLFNLGKSSKDKVTRDAYYKDSEEAYMKANELQNNKFPSWKGLIDLYIIQLQNVKLSHKHLMDFEDISENVKAKDQIREYKDILDKLSLSIDRFVEIKGYISFMGKVNIC